MIAQWLMSMLTLSLLFAPLGNGFEAKTYNAERFDVAITVEPGGVLLVTETLEFRFVGGPFTVAYRDIPTSKTAGVEIVDATFDGVALPRGDQAGQLEVKDGDPVKVTWHFAPTSDSTHTFGLTYRVPGVVFQEPNADVLRWQALPETHDYTIARSTVAVTYPAAAGVLSSQVTHGSAQVEAGDSAVTFTATSVDADEFFVFELRFTPGSLIGSPPQWQAKEEETRARQADWGRWAWPSLAAAVLVFGLGLAAILAYRQRFQVPVAQVPFTSQRPPAERHPALAGVLAQRGSLQYGWDYALGTFFALAQRGIVSVEESAETRWYRKQAFTLRLIGDPESLSPEDRAVVEVFFGTKKGLTQEMPLHTLESSLDQRIKRFNHVLEGETKALGLVDPLRRRGRNVLIGWGVTLMLVSPVLAVAGSLLLVRSALGPWPMVITGSLFGLGIVALINAFSITALSDVWAHESAAWVAFRRFLKDVMRGREALPFASGFTSYLPYVAAFGLADVWAKYLKQHEEVEVPTWFRGLDAAHTNSQAGFVAMIAAVNASGASSGASASAAAASAAAGAAGGGASGAG